MAPELLEKTPEYKEEMKKYGTGSTIQRVVQGATAVVQGLAGGDLRKAIAGGAAPEIANIIGRSGMSSQEKVLAHAVVNVALALAQGNNALSGAAGAAAGEAMGLLSERLYGKSASELTESERATVSALATLAAGLAGGLAGNSAVDAATGAQAGKTTVENNALSGVVQGGKLVVQGCAKVAACRNTLVEKGLGALLGIGAANTVLDNISAADKDYVFAVAMNGGRPDLVEKLTPAQRAAYDYLVEQDKKGHFLYYPTTKTFAYRRKSSYQSGAGPYRWRPDYNR
ncbi:VENN motif pre-toxin domain-containing protein [Apirhabdus apintestini]|nr:VENN motif pre-toxin domain-containing protein [Enterobacteriaceae bacterium CA-0114]